MTKDCNLLTKFNLEGISPATRGVPQIKVTFDSGADGITNVNPKRSNWQEEQCDNHKRQGKTKQNDIWIIIAEVWTIQKDKMRLWEKILKSITVLKAMLQLEGHLKWWENQGDGQCWGSEEQSKEGSRSN